jgi:glycosyltransferase involved in cell wall biosynthesis
MPRPLLSVVVPVYNGCEEIVANVDEIRRRISAGLPGAELETIVVSDGSIDGTTERLLEARSDESVRVIHYDRNLGKGYAVKLGALAAVGEWVALVDSDLDLDPAPIPDYVRAAAARNLDFAIGSKRHPASAVQYPLSRRVASWCYQQLNHLLFRLDVRDTQVGLKVFSRAVVDEIVPLLLVKQFAFDLELLAVARALGRGRVEEFPVRLDYRFAGSALGSTTVARALWDTFAIFYRLRILRTYDRKRSLFPSAASRVERVPSVAIVGGDTVPFDYPHLEQVQDPQESQADLVAIVAPGSRPAANWITAAVPYFANPNVAAVVTPTLAPLRRPLRELVAAAVLESRLGGGSRRSAHFPGNVRYIDDYPADSIVLRRRDHEAARIAGVAAPELVAWLASRGRLTVYTPDTSIAAVPRPLVRPHLTATAAHAANRGRAARRSRGASVSGATALSLAPASAGIAGAAFLVAGARYRPAGTALLLVYASALAASGLHAGARFRSLRVAALEPPAVLATQLAYCVGFVRGFSSRSSRRSGSNLAQSKRRA